VLKVKKNDGLISDIVISRETGAPLYERHFQDFSGWIPASAGMTMSRRGP